MPNDTSPRSIRRPRASTLAIAAACAVSIAGSACGVEEGGRTGAPGDDVRTAYFAEESCCPSDLACQDGVWCNGRELCNCWGECEPGSPITCDDSDVCTRDSCDEAADRCRYDRIPGPGCGCTVDANCNDSNACTTDRCTAGVCSNTAIVCNDGNTCTTDTCNPASGCVFTPRPSCCTRDADCNDSNSCTTDTCNAGTGTCSYANLPSGTACPDDGNLCTNDRCDAGGVCQHPVRVCDDGNVCTSDSCVPASGCVNSPIVGCCARDADCNDLNPCTTDRCNTGTGVCAFTNAPARTACAADANPCTDDWCDGSGTCIHPGAVGRACNDTLWCTVTDLCNAAGACVGSGARCSDGLTCTSDVCNEASDTCSYPVMAGSCLISGACYADGAVNPANGCQSCQPTTSQTAWSNRTAGTACAADAYACTSDVCDAAGACIHPVAAGSCLIGGVCYANGAANPANGCQSCRTAVSQTAWSSSPSGTGCAADAYACTSDVCDGAGTCIHPVMAGSCLIAGVCYPNNGTNPANQCQWCQSATNPTGWTNKPNGTGCAPDVYACTSDTCNGAGACVHPVMAGWCLIGVVCYANNANNPVNQCQWCQSATNPAGWTNKPATASCELDGIACTTDRCNGAGTCATVSMATPANDTCAAPTVMSTGGSGQGRYWTATGDSTCALDNYSTSCGGGGGGRDVVYSFNVPSGEYQLYRYRVEAGGPAPFDTIADLYGGYFPPSACGQAGAMSGCNNNDGTCPSAACWSTPAGGVGCDANDSCFYSAARTLPTGNSFVVVDSTTATGGTHTVRVDRYAAPTNQRCVAEQPEIQMGGVYEGNTLGSTYYNSPWYEFGGSGPLCPATQRTPQITALFHINHTVAPWRVNRGYILSTNDLLAPSGYDISIIQLGVSCTSPMWILGCDRYSYGTSLTPPAGLGARMITGIIPANSWSTIALMAYYRRDSGGVAWRGNYAFDVRLDDDGDGRENGLDSCPGTRWGDARPWSAVPAIDACGGAIDLGDITAKTYSGLTYAGLSVSFYIQDTRTSDLYNNDYDVASARGRDVFYAVTVPAGRRLGITVRPTMEQNFYRGGPIAYWDSAILIRRSCDSGWTRIDNAGAGGIDSTGWRASCGSAGRWYIGVDSWYNTGNYRSAGWYRMDIFGR